jgi:hypothetical protein
MKIKTACEIADACGLETILEAISNIDYHCMQIFPYDKMREELKELYNDAKNYDLHSSIYTVISRKE